MVFNRSNICRGPDKHRIHFETLWIFMIGKAFLYLSILSSFCLAIGTIVLLWKSMSWSKELLRNYFSGLSITTDEYCCNIYLIAFWMTAIWFWSLTLLNRFRNWYQFDTNVSVQLNVIFSVYYILIAVFQRHAAIREAATYNVSQIFVLNKIF